MLRNILDGQMKSIIAQEVEKQVQEVTRGMAQPSPGERKKGRKLRVPNDEVSWNNLQILLILLIRLFPT